MTDYSYSDSYRSCCNCECREQISLLQKKLTEVHAKLMAQIDLCRQQENELIHIHHSDGHGEIYETFGRKPISKENSVPNWQEDSREGYQLKNDLLQADLEAMRHRVLTEITEKNRLLEEMGDLKKRHRRELSLEVKKFEGLEILYRKLASDKGVPAEELGVRAVGRAEGEVERLRRQLEQVRAKLQQAKTKLEEEEEKNRQLSIDNSHLRQSLEEAFREEARVLQEKEQEQGRYRKHNKANDSESSDQLREIDSLKQQISRINKNITRRQQGSRESRKEENNLDLQTKLVGESRWGRRQYS